MNPDACWGDDDVFHVGPKVELQKVGQYISIESYDSSDDDAPNCKYM